jgi:hypothetical protein
MNNMEETLKKMIKDYLYYGYGLKTFISMDYPIVNEYGEENLKKLWKKVVQELGDE